jgi:hypothetical protein
MAADTPSSLFFDSVLPPLAIALAVATTLSLVCVRERAHALRSRASLTAPRAEMTCVASCKNEAQARAPCCPTSVRRAGRERDCEAGLLLTQRRAGATANAALNGLFGVVLHDSALFVCNSLQFAIASFFSYKFFVHARDPQRFARAALALALLVAAAVLVANAIADDAAAVRFFGLVANAATLFNFAAPLDNVLLALRTGDTSPLSPPFIALSEFASRDQGVAHRPALTPLRAAAACALAWCAYGVRQHNAFIYLPQLLGLAVAASQALVLALHPPPRAKAEPLVEPAKGAV